MDAADAQFLQSIHGMFWPKRSTTPGNRAGSLWTVFSTTIPGWGLPYRRVEIGSYPDETGSGILIGDVRDIHGHSDTPPYLWACTRPPKHGYANSLWEALRDAKRVVDNAIEAGE